MADANDFSYEIIMKNKCINIRKNIIYIILQEKYRIFFLF